MAENSVERIERLKRLSPAKRALLIKAVQDSAAREALAGMTARPPQHGPLVDIQPHGTKRPFFCVHPSGGGVLCYAALSGHLGPSQPFYGLQARGLDGSQSPLTRIEEMAEHYLEAIRAAQPAGPYLLGGWSMGGVVAFEMARQLGARGERVAMLALVDARAPNPASAPRGFDEHSLLVEFARSLGLPLERFPQGVGGRLDLIFEQAKAAGLVPPDIELPLVRDLFSVFKANLEALHSYSPEAPSVPIILFRAEEGGESSLLDQTLGWGPLAARGLEIYPTPGDHYTVVSEPHVKVLAEQLSACLGRASKC